MSGNCDILMGYFDCLLTTVDEAEVKRNIVSNLLAGNLEVAEASNSSRANKAIRSPVTLDTITQDRRLSTLRAPCRSGHEVLDHITVLGLLHVAGELDHGRIKQTILGCCAGLLNV